MSESENSPRQGQVGGDHYKKLKIQPVEYIHANNIGFPEGSAIKYLTRWRDKGGIEDLKKAKHFIELLIELETKAAESVPPPSPTFSFFSEAEAHAARELVSTSTAMDSAVEQELTVFAPSAAAPILGPDEYYEDGCIRKRRPSITIDHRGEPEGGPVANIV